MIPDERLVDVNGVTLFTRTVGDGPDVVVLHGGPGAHHDYLLPQFDGLATGRRLRYYDQRGGGRSPVDRNAPLDWTAHVADLKALLESWQFEPATILGYSWGGLLALLFATEHPQLVDRLALVSPAPASGPGRTEFTHRWEERMRSPEIAGPRARLRASGLRQRDPGAYWHRAFELSVAGYFARPESAKGLTPFRVTSHTQTAVWNSLTADYDIRKRIEEIRVPALVLHGRHDVIPLWTAEDTARRLEADLTILEHSGHVPHVEETDRFIAVLDAFLPRAA